MDLLPLIMLIPSLQPVVKRESALRSLSPTGVSGIVRRWMAGKLLGLSEIYIPYRLYHMKVEDRSVYSQRLLAVDSLSGALDPVEFAELSIKSRCIEIDTGNHLPIHLSEAATRASALAKFRRLIFSEGFFRLAKPVISAEVFIPELYFPYWAGFYGEEKSIKVVLLDALRGTVEGGKATHYVTAWLMENAK